MVVNESVNIDTYIIINSELQKHVAPIIVDGPDDNVVRVL